ncbi:unnamed protein product, partial [Phaeothamnion confervicola]
MRLREAPFLGFAERSDVLSLSNSNENPGDHGSSERWFGGGGQLGEGGLSGGSIVAWRARGRQLWLTEGSFDEELAQCSLRIDLPGAVVSNAAVAVFPYARPGGANDDDQEMAAVCILTAGGGVHRLVLPRPSAAPRDLAADAGVGGARAARQSCLGPAGITMGRDGAFSIHDFPGSASLRLDVAVNAKHCCWADR